MSFFEELKRRNVFRVGIAYGVAAWVLLQVADLVLENINAPDWVIQAMMLMVALGFIAALVIAWAYEMTPEGIKKESDVDRSHSVTTDTGRKMDRIIIGFLVVAVAVLLFRQSGNVENIEPASSVAAEQVTEAAPEQDLDEKSIAVLPFVNMSSDPEQEYFSDGITEEILNRLAKIQGLKVAARTSVFSFKGQNQDIREVAELLGVNTMLEGSVRRDGEQVRITAQLIRASDGFHLWSETYDRKIESIFAVQDEISAKIADALQVSLGINMAMAATANTTTPEVYDLYLKARALHRGRGQGLIEAIRLFEKALELDPEFAPAWAGLSHSLNVFGSYATPEQIEQRPDVDQESLEAAQRAIELDSGLASALHALANNQLARYQWREAQHNYELALSEDPESTDVMEDYGHFLLYSWQTEQARKVADRMIELDPYVPIFRFMASRVYEVLGDVRTMESHVRAGLDINPELWNLQLRLLIRLLEDERWEEAHQLASESNFRDWTTPEGMHQLIDWVKNPIESPKGEMLDALDFAPRLALIAGRHDIWINMLADGRYSQWETRLVYLSILSSTANEQQFQDLNANPELKSLIIDTGLPSYWREAGWPARCRPLGEDDFVCE